MMVKTMSKTAFTGRQLGEAADVLEAMARDEDCFVVMTLAGAMTVAKQGLIISELIDRGIVNALVSAHGGVASVRTAPGKGATFRIALPLAPEARGGAAADDDPDLDEAAEATDPSPAGGAADEAGEDVVTFGGKPAGGAQSA